MTWLGWRRGEKQMDAELRFHLDSQIESYVREGLSPQEAERKARREFGAVELAKDECRDQMPLAWLENLWRDLRLAVRSLRRNPGFAAAAIATFALGIGAHTAIFSAVYAVLLKPLPYFEPDQLFMVEIEIPKVVDQLGRLTGRIQDYLSWREADTVFSDVAAVQPVDWNLTGEAEPELAGGALVSTNFFSFLGVRMEHGRGFVPEEEQPGKDKVVVISDALWRRRYASDPAIIGKTIELYGQSHVVVGIAPQSLLVPTGRLLYLPFAPRIDVWKPHAPTRTELQGENWNQALLLRLKRGANPEQGRQQLQTLLNGPDRGLSAGVTIVPWLKPLRDIYAGEVRIRLLLVLAASALLLLIACVNIANLFLARVASRSAEFSIRIALGAGRARIVTQMLTESALLAIGGGIVGALVAYWGGRILVSFASSDAGLLARTSLNAPVLLFAALTSLVTGLACGILPAWQANQGIPIAGRPARFRQSLVAVEMALGTALLASAGLLLHSFVKVMRADRGYDVERVLTADVALSGKRYSAPAQRAGFYRELVERLRTLPGVLAAGAISRLPAVGDAESQVIFLDTDIDVESFILKRPVAGFRHVTPGYFSASESVLLAGRFFTDADPLSTAVVSESLAKRLWPGEAPSNAVGRRIRQGDDRGPLLSVLGVVADVRAGAIDRELLPQIYRPYLPPQTDARMTVVLKTSQDPASLGATVRCEIRKLEPAVTIPALRTMREIVSSSVAERRLQMSLTALFALVALLLGVVGVYGVVSYSVTCRTRDIGLRIALGAMRGDIVSWVLSNGMRPVLIGLAIGLAGAIALARELRSLLFGVAPADPVSLAAVALILLLPASLACYLPARRAARLDPISALRHD